MLSVRHGWSKLEAELVAALPAVPVPAAPWSPVPWMVVHDPDLFLRRLNEDVARGFNGPRSRTGAVLHDLLLVNGRTDELNRSLDAGGPPAKDRPAVKKVVYAERTGWAEAERVLLAAKGERAEGTKKAEPPVRKLRSRLIPYPF